MNSTSHPLTLIPAGEKPVLTDANEDLVLEQLRAEIMQIKTEIGQTEKPGLVSKLGFKKLPKNATISVEGDPKNTSDMEHDIFPPSPALEEALKHAIPAAPIPNDLEHLVLDDLRVNEAKEALGVRAKVLIESVTPEAQVVPQVGGRTVVPAGERMLFVMGDMARDMEEVVSMRKAAVGKVAS